MVALVGSGSLAGNLEIDDGGAFRATPNGGLDVTGTATLDGMLVVGSDMLQATRSSGAQTILTAAGGISGQFDGQSAFISLDYQPNALLVALSSFDTVAQTQSQVGVAQALNRLDTSDDGVAVFSAFANLDAESARKALDLVSGGVQASAQDVILGTFSQFTSGLLGPQRSGGSSPGDTQPLGYTAGQLSIIPLDFQSSSRPATRQRDQPPSMVLGYRPLARKEPTE